MIQNERSDIPFKIYSLLPNNYRVVRKMDNPSTINYKIDLVKRLERKETWSKGHLIKIEYYENYDADTKQYDNIILEVVQEYIYGVGDVIDYRKKDWYYYTIDNEKVWIKGGDDSIKYYLTTTSKRNEGRRRRQNVLDNIDMSVIGMLIQFGTSTEDAIEQGRLFLETYKIENESFLHNGLDDYKNAILNDTTFTWLNNDLGGLTIRQWVVNELTF